MLVEPSSGIAAALHACCKSRRSEDRPARAWALRAFEIVQVLLGEDHRAEAARVPGEVLLGHVAHHCACVPPEAAAFSDAWEPAHVVPDYASSRGEALTSVLEDISLHVKRECQAAKF